MAASAAVRAKLEAAAHGEEALHAGEGSAQSLRQTSRRVMKAMPEAEEAEGGGDHDVEAAVRDRRAPPGRWRGR